MYSSLPTLSLIGLVLLGLAALCIGCSSGTQITDVPTKENPGRPTLQIQVDGARSTTGNFVCALFANSDDFASRVNPVASVTQSVEQATWTISNVPAGRYAAAIFHDEDLDGKLGRHMLGYPTEPYGFSNNARGRFGPPRFEDAAFDFDQDLEININLK